MIRRASIDIDPILTTIRVTANRVVVNTVKTYQRNLVNRTPVDTGNLRNSWIPHLASNPPVAQGRFATREARLANAGRMLSIQRQAVANLDNYSVDQGDLVITNSAPYNIYVNARQMFIERAIADSETELGVT